VGCVGLRGGRRRPVSPVRCAAPEPVGNEKNLADPSEHGPQRMCRSLFHAFCHLRDAHIDPSSRTCRFLDVLWTFFLGLPGTVPWTSCPGVPCTCALGRAVDILPRRAVHMRTRTCRGHALGIHRATCPMRPGDSRFSAPFRASPPEVLVIGDASQQGGAIVAAPPLFRNPRRRAAGELRPGVPSQRPGRRAPRYPAEGRCGTRQRGAAAPGRGALRHPASGGVLPCPPGGHLP